MPKNLHIMFLLKTPELNEDRVLEVVRSLGLWARITPSCWYVKSGFSADQARDVLVQTLGPDDSVYVMDASTNFAAWHNLDPPVADIIKAHWFDKAA